MSLETIVGGDPKRVLMVQPRTTHRGGVNFELVSILRLGLPILAGALRDYNQSGRALHNYETMLWLEDRSGPLDLQAVEYFKPDAVILTGLVNEIPRAFELSHSLRDAFPAVPILGGGPHMSALPGEAFYFGQFDAIGHGQGTRYIGELLDGLTTLPRDQWSGLFNRLNYVSYLQGNKMVQGKGAILPMGIEKAPEPLPDYNTIHGLSKENPLPALTIQLSDSCPYRCTFCRVWTHNGEYAQVEEDMQKARWKQLNDLRERGLVYSGAGGKSAVFIVDDLAAWGLPIESNLPPGWKMADFERVRQERLAEYRSLKELEFLDNFYTIAQVRIAHGDDPEMIEAMSEGARTVMVYAGIEATDERSLRLMNKRQRVEDFERQTGNLTGAGVSVVGMGIIGLPHHTEESILEQARWFREHTRFSTVNYITHLWGTPDAKNSQFSLFADMDGTIMPMIGEDGQVIDPSTSAKQRVIRPAELLPYAQLYTGRFATFKDLNPERGWGPRESHAIVEQYMNTIRPVDRFYEAAAKRAGLVVVRDGRLIPRSLA